MAAVRAKALDQACGSKPDQPCHISSEEEAAWWGCDSRKSKSQRAQVLVLSLYQSTLSLSQPPDKQGHYPEIPYGSLILLLLCLQKQYVLNALKMPGPLLSILCA